MIATVGPVDQVPRVTGADLAPAVRAALAALPADAGAARLAERESPLPVRSPWAEDRLSASSETYPPSGIRPAAPAREPRSRADGNAPERSRSGRRPVRRPYPAGAAAPRYAIGATASW